MAGASQSDSSLHYVVVVVFRTVHLLPTLATRFSQMRILKMPTWTACRHSKFVAINQRLIKKKHFLAEKEEPTLKPTTTRHVSENIYLYR